MDSEAPMLGAGIDVVAMPVEMPADGAVVTNHDVTIHAGRGKLKVGLYGGQQAPAKLIAYRLAQLGRHQRQIVAAFEPIVDHRLALAGDIEHETGILAAHPVIELDQQLAEREVEHPPGR